MTRKILTALVSVTIVLSVLVAIFPFVSSMKPSASAGETLQHINVSSLREGNFLVEESPVKGHFQARYLVIRDHDGELKIFLIPTRDNKFMLPDHRWWRWGSLCVDFRPEMEGSKISPSGTIRCHDEKFSDPFNLEWRWSYNGENLGNYTEDMIMVPHKIEGPYVIVGKT